MDFKDVVEKIHKMSLEKIATPEVRKCFLIDGDMFARTLETTFKKLPVSNTDNLDKKTNNDKLHYNL